MARDLYSSFGGVPNTGAIGGGPMLQEQNISTNANMFGANVGEAMENSARQTMQSGKDMMDEAIKIARIDTEAKANDIIAKTAAPTLADLRAQYDSLSGPDKARGFESYVGGLNKLRTDMIAGATSPYERQILDGYMTNRIDNDTITAKRALAESMQQYDYEAEANFLMSQKDWAVDNFTDQNIVNQALGSMDAQIEKSAIDRGVDPLSTVGRDTILRRQQEVRGAVSVDMVNRAVSLGYLQEGYDIYHKNRSVIPGHQQLALDTLIGTQSVKQNSERAAEAIVKGEPVPPSVGSPVAQVQASVVRSAGAHGVKPNQALTVAYIESAWGQNVGPRGDVGQTGKGGDLHTQTVNMVTEIKKAQTFAFNALNREPEDWETYAVYQQGVGGGPALFKAASENPDARAVDVLKPLYKNDQHAYDAIVHNGGNANMTSGQFLDFLRQKYDRNARFAQTSLPGDGPMSLPGDADSLASAIELPERETGVAMQPAATPRQQLVEFDKVYAPALLRAQQIPNIEQRQGVLRALEQKRSVYAAASAAYTGTLINEAQQLAQTKEFTSLDQVRPDLLAALYEDSPKTVEYLERRATFNLENGSGIAGKYGKEYGSKYFELFRRIHAPDGTEGKINSVTELFSYMNEGGDLTPPGLDQLTKEFSRDPVSDSDGKMRDQAFKTIKLNLSGADDQLGIKDPKGEELFSRALPILYKAIEDGQSKGLSMGELTDPSNPNYIGLKVASLKRTPEQQAADILGAEAPVSAEEPKRRDLGAIMADYYGTQDPVKRAQLKKEAEDLGLIRKSLPTAPVSE